MIRTVVMTALVLAAASAFAQTSELEFGRAFGGEIKTIAKQPRSLSGSLGMTRGDRFLGDRYEATLGGTLAQDRLWFFASASVLPSQTIDWKNVTLPAQQTASPVELPSSFFLLRSTANLFSDTTTVSVSVTR
jgi:hypothetical protein